MGKYYLKDLLLELFGEDYKIDRRLYGGMMNRSYLIVVNGDEKYLCYVPNGNANKMVDRQIEKDNTRIFESLGLTSKTIYFDFKRGIKVKEYIEGKSIDNLKEYDINKVSNLLHRIHDSKRLAPNDYNPFARLGIYENMALDYAPETNAYRRLKDFLAVNYSTLQVKHKVLSHNDFQKSNILCDEDGEYCIIDFEFVGNNDEVYDIAAFANGSLEEGEELLKVYFNGNPPLTAWRRFYLWRIFISLQWSCFATIKHYSNEGKAHKFNFLLVRDHFLEIGNQAKEKFEKLPK